MPSLHELQRRIMRAILDGDDDLDGDLNASIAARGGLGSERLKVYANTARMNFTDALRSSYPVIERLVGGEYFVRCATGYHSRFPSRSGDLQPAGAAFPAFLAELLGAGKYVYMGDVARFEWLCQEALLSADHAPLDLNKLGSVNPSDYDDLRFRLAPSARLFASDYPCLAVWQANVEHSAEPEIIDLDRGGDRLLLLRAGGELNFHRLSFSDWNFLHSLVEGESFSAAVEHATSAGDFDTAAILQRFVLARVIVDFQ